MASVKGVFAATTILLMLAAVLVTHPLLAQAPTSKVYFAAGASIGAEPVNLRERHDPGMSVGIGIGLPVSEHIELVVGANYNGFMRRHNTVVRSIRLGSGNDHITSGTVGAKYSVAPNGRLSPYIVASGGVYRWVRDKVTYLNQSGHATSDGFTRTAFGIELGAGLAVKASSAVNVFVEPRYTFAFFSRLNDDLIAQYAPIRIGVQWLR